ncbi:phytoene desaturase family protein, partial [Mycolicibacterium arseniciresistens]
MSRIVVVGAGLGGLAAAARLAAAGHRVTVFESAPAVGGKLGVVSRDGFTFDTGPSLLTVPGVLEQLFADTGGPADLPLTRVDPACAYTFADGATLVLPHGAADVPAAFDDALGAGAGEHWRRLHERSRRLWELVGEPVLRRPISIPALARMSARPADLRAVAPWRTIDGLGRRMLPDPRMRMWLNRYATYSGSDPRRTPAVLGVTAFVEQEFGAWYVPGGLRRIVDAVEKRCGDLGVDIRTGTPVDEVLVSGGRACGVRAAGAEVAADAVVSNADATVLYDRLLPADAAATMRRRVRRHTRSMAG